MQMTPFAIGLKSDDTLETHFPFTHDRRQQPTLEKILDGVQKPLPTCPTRW